MALCAKKVINKMLLMHFSVLTLAVIIVAVFFTLSYVFSFLLGASSWFIPNTFFTLQMLNAKMQMPKKFIKKFYIFECLKLLLSFLLIILFLRFLSLHIFCFISGYIVSIVSAVLLPILFIFNKKPI